MKNLVVISLILGFIGIFIFGPDGILFLGLSSFVGGFLVLKFFDNKCPKCGKWFSYVKKNENYTNFVDQNILSDKVYATQNSTFECNNCKNKINTSRRVTKELKGYGNYQIDKLFKKKTKY
jgi:hypothetical protein